MKYYNILFNLPIIIILALSTCGSSQIRDKKIREQRILKLYSQTKKDKYADLLVNIDKYTTNGAYFQSKYYKHLIGVATEISEKKNLKVANGTLGFYYDNKKDKNQLYLGLEVNTEKTFTGSYSKIALTFIKNELRTILETIYSCKTVFDEKHIIGIVIGWSWSNNDRKEHVNIWISEKDILKFEQNQLLMDEVIRRSTITNTEGIIIMLPL